MGGWNLGLWHSTRFENLKFPLNKNIEKNNSNVLQKVFFVVVNALIEETLKTKDKTKVVWQLRIEGQENFVQLRETYIKKINCAFVVAFHIDLEGHYGEDIIMPCKHLLNLYKFLMCKGNFVLYIREGPSMCECKMFKTSTSSFNHSFISYFPMFLYSFHIHHVDIISLIWSRSHSWPPT